MWVIKEVWKLWNLSMLKVNWFRFIEPFQVDPPWKRLNERNLGISTFFLKTIWPNSFETTTEKRRKTFPSSQGNKLNFQILNPSPHSALHSFVVSINRVESWNSFVWYTFIVFFRLFLLFPSCGGEWWLWIA